MKTFVLDIEADGLLDSATTAWIIGWKVKETGEVFYWLNGDLGWIEELNKAELVVGHNVIGYDLMLLKKLFDYNLPKHVRVHDTMLMSQILNYNRFPSGDHKLATWGEHLGLSKLSYEDASEFFKQYSAEMQIYWERDLDVTDKVHSVLFSEYKKLKAVNPRISAYMRAENAVAKWCGMAGLMGWPFDVASAEALLERMEDELQKTRDRLLPKMGNKTVAVDKKLGVVEPKSPKWLKSGAYDAHTCRWFGIDEWSGVEDDRLVEGPYSRIVFKDLDVDSVTDVKTFLYRLGWQPLEWNTKMIPNPDETAKQKFLKINTSPKITEDSLECLEGDGKLYCDFLTTSSRVGILKGWLKHVDPDGYLHGECFTIGTPSMRARHKIIVNVPAASSVWGREMRSLFGTKPGWTMVGTDSAGNQARGLAHYLKSEEFTYQLLHGDIHTFNANALDAVLKNMGVDWDRYLIEVKGVVADDKHTLSENVAARKRASAKRIFYAFLFGASGGKLWSYIFDTPDDKKGKKLKTGFTKAVPGFNNLIDKLERIFANTKLRGDGYIPGIGGNRIYCNSFHKLLVYLLQAAEKATCGCALMLTMRGLEAEGIPYHPLIMMHDEIDYLVPDEYAGRAAQISKAAFMEGPKLMNVKIMDGDSKIGKNWYDVH